jgi:hypothetical protein
MKIMVVKRMAEATQEARPRKTRMPMKMIPEKIRSRMTSIAHSCSACDD